MIRILVSHKKSGGFYDFACRLQDAIGHDDVSLVCLSHENAADWKVGVDDTVVLQMSGYGFAKRGAPLWLLRELEMRRKNIKTLRVFFTNSTPSVRRRYHPLGYLSCCVTWRDVWRCL